LGFVNTDALARELDVEPYAATKMADVEFCRRRTDGKSVPRRKDGAARSLSGNVQTPAALLLPLRYETAGLPPCAVSTSVPGSA
jgi:hypothetical protein